MVATIPVEAGQTAAVVSPMLEMRGITKRFPGVVANDHVDFDLRAGEVHSLLGENGAGKSTLMRVLYGLYQPDEGEIVLRGDRVDIASPAVAIRHGIGMIHQHFMLVQTLTVAENVALGLPSSRGLLTDLPKVTARIHELSQAYGMKVDPDAYIWQLSVGERQRVEIIKALYRNASLLVLDEPTAVLTPQEVDDLFIVVPPDGGDGRGLVFISHKIREVLALSDRVTVLRNGRTVGTVLPADVTRADLAHMMVGREVRGPSEPGHRRPGRGPPGGPRPPGPGRPRDRGRPEPEPGRSLGGDRRRGRGLGQRTARDGRGHCRAPSVHRRRASGWTGRRWPAAVPRGCVTAGSATSPRNGCATG